MREECEDTCERMMMGVAAAAEEGGVALSCIVAAALIAGLSEPSEPISGYTFFEKVVLQLGNNELPLLPLSLVEAEDIAGMIGKLTI